ncbi:hypothetical protein SELMODRAFT_411931 [Selaginella moellendorffii]|uniref:Cyanovirin-N domain-containing protein n=1 Tax=Selaginella moellendorffii TaxID=88036 RepID=D8RJH4_SELML|nr:uncharacterized protein LOC9642076 [Selaginella moellendorffii]EFJ27905.1 hypothetical protein SELMODRAFT_411931 [Selaginella moellendorffii]|eukprot:XP_002971307.1 uncharacterized protein LOC9642076 [Selaginella moellendorffii]
MAFREVFFLCMLVSTLSITQACQFSRSCTDITFDRNSTVMRAICSTSNLERRNASIDVNNCVGSSNGVLDCSSNFASRCINISFNGLNVAARCNRGDGVLVSSSRNLDDCIQNVEGVLQCC